MDGMASFKVLMSPEKKPRMKNRDIPVKTERGFHLGSNFQTTRQEVMKASPNRLPTARLTITKIICLAAAHMERKAMPTVKEGSLRRR
jgi:hypothetical protein